MRLGNSSFKIFFLLLILMASNACTLRKRAKVNGDKPQDKVTLETPTPTPTAVATPTGIPTPPSSGAGIPQSPFSGTPPSKPSDNQTQLDLEEFRNPTYSEVDPEVLSAETTGPGKKHFTGFSDKAGRPYTDSSLDSLVPYLRLSQLQAPESQIKSNSMEFSRRLTEVRLIDTSGSQFSVRVRLLDSKNQIVTLKLSGPAKLGGRFAFLTPKEIGSLKPAPNATISGELRCVDLSITSKCSTYLLKLTQRLSDIPAFAEVVIRSSSSAVKIGLPKGRFRDSRISHLKEIFENSALKQPEGKYFDTFDMQSFAVVNGRSSFSLRMMTNDGEYLYFRGPLVSNFGNEPLTVGLSREADKMDPSNATWAPISTGSLASLINLAQLTSNNGRGVLRLELTVNESHSHAPVNFTLTFTRHLVPILDLNQYSIYFRP